MWYAALVLTSTSVVARATPLGLLPLCLRGYTVAATGYRRQAGGVVAADPPPHDLLLGGQSQYCGLFVMPDNARPHTETRWRSLWGVQNTPRSRSLTASASHQRLILREGKLALPL